MDVDRLNRWLTLAANVGVLLGIAFLAYELRQNNQNLEAELRAVHFQSTLDVWRMTAENPEIALLIAREEAGEEMSNAELIQLRALWTHYQLAIQWAWAELPEEDLQQVLPWARGNYAYFPEYRAAWQARRNLFDPGFVEYMEDNVFVED